ncbi:MAG TPA: ABC transporter permease [Ideonella sp.]|nr:ABC transporter permease [Ideonella sp.]
MTRGLLPFIQRRLLQVLPVVLGIALLNFMVLQLAPGDVVDVLAGEAGAATPESMAALRAQFGLDRPVLAQLGSYLWNIAHGNLGFSYRQNMPVFELIVTRLPATLLLMGLALAIALLLGVLLGTLTALKPGSLFDHAVSVVVLFAYAMPTFWLGLMALVLFAGKLGWLPAGGMLTVGGEPGLWALVADIARHALLPALTLSTFYLAVYARLMRGSMIETLGADFIRTARAKGASEPRVLLGHALRNASLPLVTMLGYQVASLLSGAVLVESVFSWPGLGRLAFEAVLARDFNLLLGILLLSSLLVTVINIAVDLVTVLLDPRVELQAVRT